jgi:FtsX-like permease family
MAALLQAWRLTLRGRWRSRVVIALLVGLWFGAAMALAAGARRMDSVLARNVAASRAPQLLVDTSGLAVPPTAPVARIASLPQVAAAARVDVPAIIALHSPAGVTVPFGDFLPVASEDPALGSAVERPVLKAGRAPSSARADEVAISDAFARALHAHVGTVLLARAAAPRNVLSALTQPLNDHGLNAPVGPLLRLRVVGVTVRDPTVEAPNTDEPNLIMSPAFPRAYPATRVGVVQYTLWVRLKRGEASLAGFEHGLRRLPHGPSTVALLYSTDPLQHALQIQGTSLQILALAFLLAGVLVLLPVVAREVDEQRQSHRVLRDVGLSPGRILTTALAPGMLVATVALAGAVLVEAVLSQWLEFGGARDYEPSGGLVLDPLVTTIAAAVVLGGVTGVSLLTAARGLGDPARGGYRGAEARSRVALTIARLPAPATAIAGARLALASIPSQSRAAARLRILALIAATALFAAAISVRYSADHLTATPSLYGQDFDAYAATTLTPDVARGLARNPAVRAASAVQLATAVVQGHVVGIGAFAPVKSNIPLRLLAGRAPRAPDEIALGTSTLHALHTAIGDVVNVSVGSRAIPMRVVGQTVLPTVGYQSGRIDAARGAEVTEGGGRRLLGTFLPERLLIRAAPHSLGTVLKSGPLVAAPLEVPELLDVRSLRSVTIWISAAFGLAGLVLIALAVSAVTGGRRRELALLGTFGFGPGQVRRTVAVAALWFGVIALVGLPIGAAVGRLVWNAIAGYEGVVSAPQTPWLPASLAIPALLAFALLCSLLAARAVNRRPLTDHLRFAE